MARRVGQPSVSRVLSLVGLLAILVATGWAIALVWRVAGLPLGAFAPGLSGHPPNARAWPRLFAVWLPVAYGLFTLSHVSLTRVTAVSRRYLRADGLTYLGLAGFLALEGFLGLEGSWRHLPGWRLWLAGAYLLLVFAKTAILVRALYIGYGGQGGFVVEAPDRPAAPRTLSLHLFAAALGVYVLTAAYLATAISSTGDEPYYLLVAASLIRDGDLDLANNFAQEDYLPFYWGRLYSGQNTVETPTGALYSVTYSGLLAYLIAPGVALAGRLGAMITIAVLAALLMVQVFRLAWETTGSLRASWLVWLFLAFVSPVLVFSSQVYPEIPAALLVACAARVIRRLPAAPRRHFAVLALCLLALVLLKIRYAALAMPLAAWALWRLRRGRAAVLALAGVTLVAAGLVVLDRLSGGLLYLRYVERIPFRVLLEPRAHMLVSLLGMFLDQEFGLLPYSPIYVLAALGLPLALRRDREYGFLLATAACYVYPFLHSFEWYGGFSPPFRYLVAIVPVLAIPVAHALTRAQGPVLATMTGAAWAWSLAVAFLITLHPTLRLNRATGEATWLRFLGDGLGADLPRLLPTLVNHSAETPWLLAGAGVAMLGGMIAVRARRRRQRAAEDPAPSFPRVVPLLSVASVLAVLAALVVAARITPTVLIQGEHMAPQGKGVFFPGTIDLPFKAWVMRSSGSLSKPVRLPGGPVTLTVAGGGYSTDAEPPHLVVSLDDRRIGEVDVVAGREEWRRGTYRFAVTTSGGAHRLTLTLTNGLDAPGARQVRQLLIDSVRIERVE